MYPSDANALAWMSRKKFGTCAAFAAADVVSAAVVSAAVVAAVGVAAAVVVAAVDAESLADCADRTFANVVRASVRPSAADRCRSKGPPRDVSACGGRSPSGGWVER